MRKYIYASYFLWVLGAVILGIVSKNYYALLSPILLPLGVAITLAVFLVSFMDYANRQKKKAEAKIKDSCDVCLFNETAKYSPEAKCLGCVMDENHKYGEMCKYYSRHISGKKPEKPQEG